MPGPKLFSQFDAVTAAIDSFNLLLADPSTDIPQRIDIAAFKQALASIITSLLDNSFTLLNGFGIAWVMGSLSSGNYYSLSGPVDGYQAKWSFKDTTGNQLLVLFTYTKVRFSMSSSTKSIIVELGPNYFVVEGGGSVPGQFQWTQPLTTIDSDNVMIKNLQDFSNNAAAIAGGLTADMLYRNGDIVQIVH